VWQETSGAPSEASFSDRIDASVGPTGIGIDEQSFSRRAERAIRSSSIAIVRFPRSFGLLEARVFRVSQIARSILRVLLRPSSSFIEVPTTSLAAARGQCDGWQTIGKNTAAAGLLQRKDRICSLLENCARGYFAGGEHVCGCAPDCCQSGPFEPTCLEARARIVGMNMGRRSVAIASSQVEHRGRRSASLEWIRRSPRASVGPRGPAQQFSYLSIDRLLTARPSGQSLNCWDLRGPKPAVDPSRVSPCGAMCSPPSPGPNWARPPQALGELISVPTKWLVNRLPVDAVA